MIKNNKKEGTYVQNRYYQFYDQHICTSNYCFLLLFIILSQNTDV